MNFNEKELIQIIVLSQDMTDFMSVFGRNVKGLSLTAFNQDMLSIQAKAELMLQEVRKTASPPAN